MWTIKGAFLAAAATPSLPFREAAVYSGGGGVMLVGAAAGALHSAHTV